MLVYKPPPTDLGLTESLPRQVLLGPRLTLRKASSRESATPSGVRKHRRASSFNLKRPTTQAEQLRKLRLLFRYRDRVHVFGDAESEDSFVGHVLILTFEHIDFHDWKASHAKLVQTFTATQCSVITRYMDSPNFLSLLQRFLDKRYRKPRIVYVDCHGGETADGFELSA